MRVFLFLLIMLPLGLQAQFTYSIDQTIPVRNSDNSPVPIPWAGGLNAVQTNTMDLNHDGQQDLVLFDRMGNKVITYLRTDNAFAYHPEYEIFFPEDILNWVLLRDFNCDGRKDLFTGDNLGMKVFINKTETGQSPQWEQFYFSTGFGGKIGILLSYSPNLLAKTNVQLQYDDLPSIMDADGDGDLDIFCMRYAASGQIEFHKNLSKEKYNTCDSLDFQRMTQNWGNVRECSCGKFAFNGSDCASGGRVKHAGGKSLLALDVNANGEPEMLFSEAECSQLFLLNNQGSSTAPLVNAFSQFPPSTPANIILYPTPYLEDIDGDGVHDLVVSSNSFIREFLNSDYSNSNYFYRNVGTNELPNFTLVKRNFLQGDMLDFGDNSVPAWFDYDGDDDLDLFVSMHNNSGLRSPVAVYENTGNNDSPTFKLYTDDLLGLSILNEFNRKIQFADLNKDGKADFVYTATDAILGETKLYYITNLSQSGLDLSSFEIVPIDVQLDRNDNVYVFDVTGDGTNDLLIGRADGAVELWTRSGPTSYVMANEKFLNLGPSVMRQNVTMAIADLDSDGKLDFLYGDQAGRLSVVPDFKNVNDAESASVTNIVFNPLSESFTSVNLGGRIWPAVATLFGSSRPSIIVGNSLGGLQILNSDGPDLPAEPVIDVYPNPVTAAQTLSIRIDRPASVELISLVGQRLTDPIRLQPFAISSIDLPTLANGIYILKFAVGKKTYSKKLVVDR